MSNSLSQILNNGRTSLLAHQKALATTSNNAANISTENYHRRDLHFSSQKYENGVDVRVQRRTADEFLRSEIYRHNAASGAADARTSSLSAIQQLFAEGDGALGSAIDRFFKQVHSLSVAPTDLDRRQSMVSAAKEVTQTFNGISNRLNNERRGIDANIDNLADQVNSLVKKLADLNDQISKSTGDESEQGAILDQQEGLVRELSEYVPISTFREPNGHLTVLINRSEPLVQGNLFAQLKLDVNPTGTALRTLELEGISGVRLDLSQSLDQGKIGGLLHLRDTTLANVLGRLDELAFNFGNAFNSVHSAGFGMDGSTGNNMFSNLGATAEGAANRIDVESAIANSPNLIAAAVDAAHAVGGNKNLLKLEAVQDQTIAGAGTSTYAQEIASLVGEVGRIAKDNEEKSRRAKVSLQTSKNLEQANIGVSLDEEMIDLMQYQRAYQAGSKVVQTVNQLYEIVMQLK